MKCHLAERWMDAALDGESPRGLPAGWQAQLESHMAGCAHCRAQWELLRAAEQALRVPRAAPAPEGMLGDFRRRLAHESPAAHPTRRPWGWLWPTTSLAAAGAVAVLAVTLNLQAPLIPGKTSSSAGPEMAGGPGPSIMTQRAEPSGPVPPSGPPATSEDGAASGSAAASGPTAGTLAAPAPGTLAAPEPGGSPAPTPPEDPGAVAGRDAAPAEPKRSAAAGPRPPVEPVPPPVLPSGAVVGPVMSGQPTGRPGSAAGGRVTARASAPDTASGSGGFGGGAGAAAPSGGLAGAAGGRPGEGPTGPAAAGAPMAESIQADASSKAARLRGSAAAQQMAAAEASVSPALLTALQRPVDVKMEETSLQDAALQLTEAADVPVMVDPRAPRVRVQVREASAPLWLVLEDLARQGNMQIFPEENQLVLRPVGMAPAKPSPSAKVRGAQPPSAPGASEAPAPPAQRLELFNRKPDRRVWPADWGTLPDRGFEMPAPDRAAPPGAPVPGSLEEKSERPSEDQKLSETEQRRQFFRQKEAAKKPRPPERKK